jgi:hypothetical protein
MQSQGYYGGGYEGQGSTGGGAMELASMGLQWKRNDHGYYVNRIEVVSCRHLDNLNSM